MKISATIIAKNEEGNIANAIESVKSFADEVVVVIDTRTFDRTSQIAKAQGARVFLRRFDNFANQKNFAAQKATGDWIFSLDADEEIGRDFAVEARKAVNRQDVDGYLIPRKNIIFGKEIKHTRWSPDKHIWLWRKSKGKWVGSIHEEVVVKGRVGELKSAKIHHSHKTVSDFLEMLNNYTLLEAQKIIENGKKFSLFKFFTSPIISFFGRYFYKLGFMDGWRGFVLSYLRAMYKCVVWVKVWDKQR